MEKKYYFAYGSNLNREAMAARCPGAKLLGTGILPGQRLVFRGRGSGNYLTIEPAAQGSVPVGVWAVDPQEEKALDLYEDYPVFYRKEFLTIDCHMFASGQNERVRGFVYIMRDGFPAGRPEEAYMRACLEGYSSFGFDPETLYAAERYSVRLAEKAQPS